MISYAIFVLGQETPIYTFTSAYHFEPQERVFIPNQPEGVSYVIAKITHDVTTGTHIVRLNCTVKKSF